MLSSDAHVAVHCSVAAEVGGSSAQLVWQVKRAAAGLVGSLHLRSRVRGGPQLELQPLPPERGLEAGLCEEPELRPHSLHEREVLQATCFSGCEACCTLKTVQGYIT